MPVTDATETFSAELTALIPHMRSFARSLCGDLHQAEDIAQEAVANAWAHRASFQPGTNLKAWLFMIVRNQFYSNKRRDWRSTPLDPEIAERTLVANNNPTGAIELDDLRRAMMMLPDDQREALILIGAGGLSYEEAAEVCGAHVGTIKSRVSRARDKLALILQEGDLIWDGLAPSQASSAIFRSVDDLQARRCA